jgi:hypothetical protein
VVLSQTDIPKKMQQAPLRVVEFRIPMPLTADEYEVGSYWSCKNVVPVRCVLHLCLLFVCLLVLFCFCFFFFFFFFFFFSSFLSHGTDLHAVELQEKASAGSTGIKQSVREFFENADAEDPRFVVGWCLIRLTNENRMEEGWKREKVNYFGSHLPAVLRGLAPEGALSVSETSYDCFPYRKSIFRSGERFCMERGLVAFLIVVFAKIIWATAFIWKWSK